MLSTLRRRALLRWALAGLLLPLLAAANTVEDIAVRPNFAGHWEKDYARSDRWDEEMYRTVQDVQQRALVRQRRGDGHSMAISHARVQARAIVASARLAESITRDSGLRITQGNGQVRIEREHDAPLVCGTDVQLQTIFESAHGSETCRWERNQLVFDIRLAAGAVIVHRFDVDAEAGNLRLLTQVASRNDTPPFELRQTFARDAPPSAMIDCAQTLTRGQVCRRQTPSPP